MDPHFSFSPPLSSISSSSSSSSSSFSSSPSLLSSPSLSSSSSLSPSFSSSLSHSSSSQVGPNILISSFSANNSNIREETKEPTGWVDYGNGELVGIPNWQASIKTKDANNITQHEMQVFLDSILGKQKNNIISHPPTISPPSHQFSSPSISQISNNNNMSCVNTNNQQSLDPSVQPNSFPYRVDKTKKDNYSSEEEVEIPSKDNKTKKRKIEKEKKEKEKEKTAKDNIAKDEESGAREMVHKLSEKSRRDRLSVRYTKLQELIQLQGISVGMRKGRNGELRREDVLEMCEKFILKSSNKLAVLNSAVCKMAASVTSSNFFHLHSPAEIDGCFDSILSDLWRAYLGCDRPYRIFSRQLLTLNIMVEKSLHFQYKLFALATNCITYTFIDLQPKEGLEVAQIGWNLYKSVQPNYKENFEKHNLVPILYQGIDVGTIFLGHMALLIAALGRYKEASKVWTEFVEFAKSFDSELYKLTNFLPKTMEVIFRTWQGELTSRKNYYSYMPDAAEMAPQAPSLVPRVLCGLGYIVSSTSSTPLHPTPPSTGVDICERSVLESIKYGGEFADLTMCNFVVSAYYFTGKYREGLVRADQFLNKISVVGALGSAYCSVIRYKADCMVKLAAKETNNNNNKTTLLLEAIQVYNHALTVAHSIGHAVYEMDALLALANLSLSGQLGEVQTDDLFSKISLLWKNHDWSDLMVLKIKPFVV